MSWQYQCLVVRRWAHQLRQVSPTVCPWTDLAVLPERRAKAEELSEGSAMAALFQVAT